VATVTAPTGPLDAGASDPAADYRSLAIALRVGAVLLTAGASTDDVERAMRRVARAAGLEDVQSVVILGILTISAVRASDRQPITQTRIVGRRTSDSQRLVRASRLVDRIEAGKVSTEEAAAELDRIDALPPPYSAWVLTLAMALSSAASTVLFGGTAQDALATLAIGLAVEPVVRRVETSGLPEFFQVLIGPFLATALAVILVAVGLPINGGLVVTGAILRFLPGAALVAGLRDLIDRSIISGSARLAEALLLGAAVAGGTALALTAGTALGGPVLRVGELGRGPESTVAQAVAAGFACAFFALRLGVERRTLVEVFLLGGAAWAIALAGAEVAVGGIAPTVAAAVVVGVVAQALALRRRMPSVIWSVPAVLPLLPGLTTVRGILEIDTIEGLMLIIAAIASGFALGAGVAFGSIAVAVAREARAAAPSLSLPILDDWRGRSRE
jgi:uncharacterized membrane protein YjjP (DUF1212 family)